MFLKPNVEFCLGLFFGVSSGYLIGRTMNVPVTNGVTCYPVIKPGNSVKIIRLTENSKK